MLENNYLYIIFSILCSQESINNMIHYFFILLDEI